VVGWEPPPRGCRPPKTLFKPFTPVTGDGRFLGGFLVLGEPPFFSPQVPGGGPTTGAFFPSGAQGGEEFTEEGPPKKNKGGLPQKKTTKKKKKQTKIWLEFSKTLWEMG